MKRALAAIAISSCLSFVINAQRKAVSTDVIKNHLITLEKQSWEAWKNRDGKFFQNFLADDHVEVGATGVATKAQIVAFVGSPICVVQSYSVDTFKFVMLDANTAVLTYRAEQNTTCGGKPVPSPAWTSSIYVKRDGRWLNAVYQQTPIGR